jgi:ferric-dicitrate binding protein FerR (iron transport regulator)
LLFPGEKAEISAGDDTFIKSVNSDRNYLSWKTRHMDFENTPLNEVVALLTKVYQTNVRLAGSGLSDCRISTTFDDQTLESVLDVLKATLDLQVTKTASGIELSGSSCGSRE